MIDIYRVYPLNTKIKFNLNNIYINKNVFKLIKIKYIGFINIKLYLYDIDIQ